MRLLWGSLATFGLLWVGSPTLADTSSPDVIQIYDYRNYYPEGPLAKSSRTITGLEFSDPRRLEFKWAKDPKTGNPIRIVTLNGKYKNTGWKLLWRDRPLILQPKDGSFSFKFIYSEEEGNRLSFSAVGFDGQKINQHFIVSKSAPHARRVPAAFQPRSKQKLKEVAPPPRKGRIGLSAIPEFQAVSQTLLSTAESFKFTVPAYRAVRVKGNFVLSDDFEIVAHLGYSGASIGSKELELYQINASSSQSLSGGLALEQVNMFSDGSQLRPILGLAYQPSYILEFQSNTELSLKTIGDVKAYLGASYRFSKMSLSLQYEKGLGLLTGNTAVWTSSEHFAFNAQYSQPLSETLLLDIGVGLRLEKNVFSTKGDNWNQGVTSTGLLLGVTSLF